MYVLSYSVIAGTSGHVELSELWLADDAMVRPELPFHSGERVANVVEVVFVGLPHHEECGRRLEEEDGDFVQPVHGKMGWEC